MGRRIQCLSTEDALLEKLLVQAGPRQLLLLKSRGEVDSYKKSGPQAQTAVFVFDITGGGETLKTRFLLWQHTTHREGVAFLQTDRPLKRLRPYGLAQGQIRVPSDFNDPLPDELISAFEGQ